MLAIDAALPGGDLVAAFVRSVGLVAAALGGCGLTTLGRVTAFGGAFFLTVGLSTDGALVTGDALFDDGAVEVVVDAFCAIGARRCGACALAVAGLSRLCTIAWRRSPRLPVFTVLPSSSWNNSSVRRPSMKLTST